jgi:hypothetical protein
MMAPAAQHLLALVAAARQLDVHPFALSLHPDACRPPLRPEGCGDGDMSDGSSAMLSPLSTSDDVCGPEWWTAAGAPGPTAAAAAGEAHTHRKQSQA